MNLASPKISQIEKDKIFLNLDNDASLSKFKKILSFSIWDILGLAKFI